MVILTLCQPFVPTHMLCLLSIYLSNIYLRGKENCLCIRKHTHEVASVDTKPKPSYCCLNAEVNLVLFAEWTERLSGGSVQLGK